MHACRARSIVLILLAVDKVICLLLNILLCPVPLELFNSLRIVLRKLWFTLV